MTSINLIAQLGDVSLAVALIVAAYAIGASVAGARKRNLRLVRSGITAAYGTTALISFSSALIFFAILSNDYSIKYVQRYSDASMPWYYKITSFWGGLDGSMMFWALLLALFSSVAIWANRERHRELIPYVTAILFTVVGFFLVLIIFEKRPFDVFLTDAPRTGKGLNPLLQNPYMATHPPSLYLGFVSATVPFAFGLAALITGNLDDAWLHSVRRWAIVSWYFLSQGLVLGSLWAYEELGWGGYWGWDPVENAGFLPWLTSTAFIHSVLVQERRGMLKVWNVCLVITTFLLTMVGTFMTRSGIVQSVHAFGQDNELAVIFLCWIGFIATFSFGFVIYRLPLLRSRNELESWVSREFAFLVNNWILLSAAFFVLVATLFPTISEFATGERITVGPPFFNKWMTPIGLILLFLTGVGPLIAWRKASVDHLWNQFAFPLAMGVGVAGGLAFIPAMRAKSVFLSDKIEIPVALICFGLCAFVTGTISQEFYRGTRVRQKHTKLDFFTALVGLVARGKRRYGGYLVHIAMVLMFLGFAGGAYKKDAEVTLERGKQVTVDRYTVRFDDLKFDSDAQKESTAAQVTVFVGGREMAKMYPAKWAWRHHEEEPPSTEVEIHRMLKEDLYIVLNGYDAKEGLANLHVVVNPLVNWVWLGFVLLAIGTLIAFLPDRAYALAGATDLGDGGKAVAAAAILALTFFGFMGAARAQNSEHVMEKGDQFAKVARNPLEAKLFKDLVCQCGTCGRQTLAECTCGTAVKMRAVVAKLLDDGKDYEGVIAYHLSAYPGQSALVVPLDKGFNRLAWALPMGMILGAAGFLIIVARKWSGKKRLAAAQGPDVATEDAAYSDKLDDELDKLS